MKRNNLQLPWLNAIRFCRLRLFYRGITSGQVAWFLGPEVRGSIGHQLKSYMGCSIDLNEDCAECPQERKRDCIYAQFFVNGGNSSKGIVLKLDPAFRGMKSDFVKGETLQLDVNLLGIHIQSAWHFLSALRQYPLRLGSHGLSFELAESGFVNEKGEFMPLQGVDTIPSMGLFPSVNSLANPCRIELTLQTPTEITLSHRKYIYDPEKLTFKLLVLRMLERSENIARDLCNWPDKGEGRKGPLAQALIDQAQEITLVDHHAHWRGVKFRNNQGRGMGGLVGTFIYDGNLAPYIELLESAVYLGLGKGATAGFGQVSFHINH
ncbi:MAG: CRISPR system precrRNA processing endoribonuclease RAMP protein Cas6 [Thermodesulfobacteriota bacterium]|nr:CRISPR system precrRNA processing endoribonuclease RAMP protein Cas6 [Thermodesulfobacteriota bacterium]